MSMSGKSPGHEAALPERLAARIATEGPLRFSQFMEMALYDAREGYYASGRAAVGKQGDFFTNVSVGSIFGGLLARQFVEMQAILAGGGEFRVVEQGAHDGRLARDILEAARALGASFRYTIIEPFAIPRERQMAALDGFGVEWVTSPDELTPFEGVHFSNELFDALPVDILKSDGSRWIERRVGWGAEGFVWSDGAESPVALPVRPAGFLTEIRTGQNVLLESLAAKMTRGFLLAMDYGMSRTELLAPHRREGTLACYRGHRRDADPFADVGQKDITAHVDFTALVEEACDAGFSFAAMADQHHFLVGAATAMLLELDGVPPTPETTRRLRSLQMLLHPETMGRQFQALLLTRGDVPWAGLAGFRHARPSRLFSEVA